MKIKLLICFCFFFHCVGFTQNSKPKSKEIILSQIKTDSLSRMIKRLGKDSLIHLLTQRIEMANRVVASKAELLHNEDPALCYFGFAKHYQIDTLDVRFTNLKLNNLFFKMYDHWFGNYHTIYDTIEMIKKANLNTDDLFLGSMHQKYARYVFGFYCKELSFRSATIDSIYKFKTKLSDREQFNLYYVFIEATKSCKSDTINYYKNKLSKSLESLARFTGAIDDKQLSVESLNLFYPLRYQALRLYDRQLSIKTGGKEFVLLLESQLKDGGWPDYLIESSNSEVVPTIFGLWSMLEWRAQLMQLK